MLAEDREDARYRDRGRGMRVEPQEHGAGHGARADLPDIGGAGGVRDHVLGRERASSWSTRSGLPAVTSWQAAAKVGAAGAEAESRTSSGVGGGA